MNVNYFEILFVYPGWRLRLIYMYALLLTLVPLSMICYAPFRFFHEQETVFLTLVVMSHCNGQSMDSSLPGSSMFLKLFPSCTRDLRVLDPKFGGLALLDLLFITQAIFLKFGGSPIAQAFDHQTSNLGAICHRLRELN